MKLNRIHLNTVQERVRGGVAASISFCVLLVALSGCTNNLLKGASGKLSTNGVTATTPTTATGDNSSGLVLSRIQKNSYDPTTTLDLVGDGSGAMAQFCTTKIGATGASGNTGPSSCTCAYSYTTSSGTQIGPVEVDTVYHENDQLRCLYNTIPAGVASLNVYIHITSSDTRSNALTFKFTGTGVTLDTSSAASFSLVKRFQCRDIVWIPSIWDQSVIDPILSEDARYSYPLDFYTTNMGKTMAMYSGGGPGFGPILGWNCPAIPNDPSAGTNLNVFSVASDLGNSKMIYPPSGVFDRSTFYVAKAKSGVFTMPVNAYILPGVFTQTQPNPVAGQPAAPAGVPPLGYAAAPTPITGGGEACPDSSVQIPQGFHWAKLWLFRKQLPQRSYPFSPALQQAGGIACNLPPWKNPDPSQTIIKSNNTYFPDCAGEVNYGKGSTDANGLAARFLEGLGMCALFPPALSPVGGAGKTTRTTLLAAGSDLWNKPTVKYDPMQTLPHDIDKGCGGASFKDPLHICNAGAAGPLDGTLPVSQGLIDSSVDTARFDYLFVVSKTDVMRTDMDPSSSSAAHSIYTPTRFMSATDCLSNDPDNPSGAGDCSPNRLLTYQLKVHEVGSPGNPGQDDPNRPGDYPMCVLQPN